MELCEGEDGIEGQVQGEETEDDSEDEVDNGFHCRMVFSCFLFSLQRYNNFFKPPNFFVLFFSGFQIRGSSPSVDFRFVTESDIGSCLFQGKGVTPVYISTVRDGFPAAATSVVSDCVHSTGFRPHLGVVVVDLLPKDGIQNCLLQAGPEEQCKEKADFHNPGNGPEHSIQDGVLIILGGGEGNRTQQDVNDDEQSVRTQ